MTSENSPLIDKALAIALGLFVLSVIIRGGNLPLIVYTMAALAAVTLLAVGILQSMGRVATALAPAAHWLGAGMLLIVISGLVGLITISASTWLSLPGRSDYAPVFDALRSAPWQAEQFALALDSGANRLSTLTALGAFACIAVALSLSRDTARRLLGLIASVAIFEALLGLLQLALNSPSFLAFGTAVGGNRAAGTFVNKNHFATLLAMCLPLLIFRSAGLLRFGQAPRRASSLRDSWWAMATAVVLAALVSSVSRAGVAAGALATGAAALIAYLSARDTRQRVLLAIIALLAILLSVASGLGMLLKSLEGVGFVQSAAGRHALNIATWNAALTLLPVGGGLGSYALAFQRFQTPALEGFYEYAHNDYLQLLFELGAVGVVIIALWAVALTQVGTQVLRSRREHRVLASPAVACLLGCLAFAVHAWFDFPAHIPALAWIAASLAAFSTRTDLLGEHRESQSSQRRHKHRRKRGGADTANDDAAPTVAPAPTISAVTETPVDPQLFAPPPDRA